MTCPTCNMKLQPGSACPRCGPAEGSAEARRAEFESLPPCYNCGGAGIVAGPTEEVPQSEAMKRRGRVVPKARIKEGGQIVHREAPEARGYAACACRRGQWMKANGALFAPHGGGA